MTTATNRDALTKEELAGWANSNGFRETEPGVYATDWDGTDVVIDLSGRGVRTKLVRADLEQRLVSVPSLRNVSIDDNGVVAGIGLGMSLAASLGEGRSPPPWFPKEVVDKLSGTDGNEPARIVR